MRCLLIISLFSCETEIDLELNDNISKLVVVGEITDQNTPPRVTLSQTAAYSSNQPTPKISGAVVKIIDDFGEIISLPESREKGIYIADDSIQGKIGRSYILQIELPSGKIYTSFPEKLNPVAPIDSLAAEFLTDVPEEDAWFVTVYFNDPPVSIDYYRWKIFINGTFMDRAEDLYSTGFESVLNGEPIDLSFLEFPLEEGDQATVQQLSLTEEAQQFLFEVEVQTKATGGPFDAPVAPIIGNIRNKDDPNDFALGYFFASSVTSESITIK